MEANELFDFIAGSISVILGMPAILILMSQWRFSLRKNILITAVLAVVLAVFHIGAYQLLGVTCYSKLTVGVVTSIFCISAFIYASGFRDGRIFFSTVTAAMLAALTESFACILVPYGTFFWLAVKITATVAQCIFLYFFCRKPYIGMLRTTSEGWVLLSLLPLSLLASMIAAYLYPVIIMKEYVHYSIAVILSASGVIIYIILYFFLETMKNQYIDSRDNTILHAQMQYLERQTEQLRSGDMAIRVLRHDMRHHIILLQSLISIGDSSGMAEVLNDMEGSLNKISGYSFINLYTGNTMVDTVISLYANRARDNWIKFDVSLELPDSLNLDVVKLTVVISNAVENAVNACIKIPAGQKREIRIIGSMRAEQFFLSVANTFFGQMDFDPESGLPITNKTAYDYGIQSIVGFAREYNAILHFGAADGWFTFSILI